MVGILLFLGPQRLSSALVRIRGGFESKLLDEDPSASGAALEEGDTSSNEGMHQTKRQS